MSKKKHNSQENGSHEQEVKLGTVGRHKRRSRTLAPAVGVVIIAVAASIWFNCNDGADTATDEPSKVAQSGGETANDNPPPEHYTGGPSIYFPTPSHDFGNIDQGDKVSHTFIVQNYGDKPLKLIKAKGS